MKPFKILKFLDCFKFFFEKAGVDYGVMRKILEVKLMMDRRRIPTVIGNNRKKDNDENSNNFLKSLLIYLLLGLILVPFVIMGKNYVFQMSFIMGIMMFMIMSSIISDFSAVLLDIRDKNILLTKPINSITINTAKLLHILIYMFQITLAMMGLALITSLFRHGILFFLVFALEIIMMDLFIIVISALLYLLILRFFDGEKLKDIINYFQIGLSISILVGSQLIGRLFQFVDFHIVFQVKWWQYFIIPVWFSGPYEIIFNHNYSTPFIVFTVLAVVVPFLAIILYIKLIPTFEASLQKLNENSAMSRPIKTRRFKGIGQLLCRTTEERAFYSFAAKMVAKEREFKLKVYPSIGLSVVLPFIMILTQMRDQSLKGIGHGRMYFTIYFCILLLPTVIMMMKYSGGYKGAWIYKVLPIKDHTLVFKATLKALIVKLMLPIILIESGIFVVIFGARISLDLIIVFLSMLLFAVISFFILKKGLPFSEPFGIANQTDGGIMLLLMLVLGMFAGVHLICSFFVIAKIIYAVLLLILNWLSWKYLFSLVTRNFVMRGI